MNEKVPLLPGTLFDRYRVQSSTGDAGFVRAVCHDTKANRMVSVVGVEKSLLDHPGTGYTLALLQADVQQARASTHPSVLQAEEMLQDDKRIYVVSEVSEGLSLSRLPKRVANISTTFAAGAMVRLLSLIELSQRIGQSGLCLSPSEAYLSPKGVIKVENFATARLMHVARAIHNNNGAGSLLGSFGAFREAALCRADDAERAAVMIETLAELPETDDLRPMAQRIAGNLRNSSSQDNSIADAVEQLRGVQNSMAGKRPLEATTTANHARRTLRPGEYLFHQGDASNGECYVLDDGLVQISKCTNDGRELFLDLSKPGDIIGEMAVLDDRPRMASAMVLEPSEVVIIKGADFLARLEKSDIIAVKLLEVMASRIRYQSSEIARLKEMLGAKA
ncbi:cyclic nucleotide-binding domain-containing protein [Magnetospirillum sp. 64-120]|uniref:cyclic nucleotide-binding domain-containing protein n=1 Tax=Magnetospirillum sp. 64-120 TaxID=1895778 RepID=UPI0009290549|nr:cyclic nucleotide-binding domain-containing protein [Magnetospirillum sp. 64-120]OJX82936.1 MAG: hypothetical protein BGO92_19875 [Magnetospirillum sp. 64-120]